MSTDKTMARQAIHDKLEARIKTIEAKLNTLKARAETAKANAELRAIAELVPRNQMMQQMLQELKKGRTDRWEQAKTDLEAAIADIEKSAQEIEARAKED